MIAIRKEQADDAPAIRKLNGSAFDGPAEANVVDTLRRTCDGLVSLVAVDGDEVVGHILFSPATAGNGNDTIQGMGLAPMAVLPNRQREGIGSALIEHGLALLREQGCPFVIVLGHAEYYPRFGFERASHHGLNCEWDGVPDEVFMVAVFDEDALKGAQGVVRYRVEFNTAM